ncbi:DUF6188 family protein [Mycolicibacterium litorale]|uniref:DUF6188 family protein n=1 Tax=Mycolicibacterium litorale TaxID=758802 RepID=UPI003CFA0228
MSRKSCDSVGAERQGAASCLGGLHRAAPDDGRLLRLAVGSTFSLRSAGRTITLDSETDAERAFDLMRPLIGTRVETAVADSAGALCIRFSGGADLSVDADAAYEAWSVSGPDGALVVCTPGGKLAVWSESKNKRGVEVRRPTMNAYFHFLRTDQQEVLTDLLTRRNPALVNRIRQSGSVSHSDAEQIMSVLSEELLDHLDEEWKPTFHGQIVSELAAQFNAARLQGWL